jgi:protoporphyrinogen oxidase/glycosyltransferase involved in cell wall biosynthesis
MQSLIVFSHLRWDSASQRPQHLLRRLATHFRVFYVEEPVLTDGRAFMDVREPAPNVHVCQPHTPVGARGFHDDQLPHVQPLLENLLAAHDLTNPIAWMYTPMALPLLQRLDAKGVVYDCIGDLAAQPGAPRQLAQREHALLKAADVVFTSGRGLYRARQALHENVHYVPSGVEARHFARARGADADHEAQAHLPHPRLGFFGTLDERIDPATLALLADAHPQWQISLVGPVRRIDSDLLPRRPNIHYFGERHYSELPAFLAGWDACLLPFAMNESTRHANPAQLLEFMAAEKPIVVTPVADVVEAYGHIVHVGRHSQSFISACEQVLSGDDATRFRRLAMMRNVVGAASWEATAEKVRNLIEDSLATRPRRHGANAAGTSPPQRKRAIVIGAGPTGLAAAYHLGEDSLLLEQHEVVGGGCRSIRERGFTFDHGGHAMLSDDAEVHEMYRLLLGGNVRWQGAKPDGAAGGDEGRDAQTGASPNPRLSFGYPLRGGFQALVNGFLPLLRGELKLNARVSRVVPARHLVTLASGESYVYDKLVSTMPLPVLVGLLGEEAPTRVRKAASQLRQLSLRCVNLGVAREGLSDQHWAHYPADTVFHRVFMQGNASPHNNPRGGFALTCEIGYSPDRPLPCDGEALIDRCIADCVKVGIFAAGDAIIVRNQVDIPYAYVIEDEGRAHAVEAIRHWLAARDIVIAGRYGAWQPCENEHAFVAGRETAQHIETALAAKFGQAAKPRDVVAYLIAPQASTTSSWQAPNL